MASKVYCHHGNAADRALKNMVRLKDDIEHGDVSAVGLSLYGQIAGIFRSKILSGEWPKGTQLDPISKLSVIYDVAQVTIRQALQILAKEGMVSSERGRGTFVTYNPGLSSRAVDAAIEQSLVIGPDHKITVIERQFDVRKPVTDWFPGAYAQSYVRVRKVHSEAGAPYCLADAFAASDIYARFPQGADETEKIIRLIRDYGNIRIVGGRERFTVENANISDAQLLKCPVTVPVARVRRAFSDEHGVVVFYAINIYRGDRFALERDFTGYIQRIW